MKRVIQFGLILAALMVAPVVAQESRPVFYSNVSPTNPCKVVTSLWNNWLLGQVWQCKGTSHTANTGTWQLMPAGKSATATAADHTPTICGAGQAPRGVDATWAATGCQSVSGGGGGSVFTGSIATTSTGIGGTATDRIFSCADQSGTKSPIVFQPPALAANVSSVAFTSCPPGAHFMVPWVQNGSGNFTVAYGGSTITTCPINPAANSTTVQEFIILADSTAKGVGCSSDGTEFGACIEAAASATPPAGQGIAWCDNGTHVLSYKSNNSSTVSNTAVPNAGASNEFFTSFGTNGVFGRAQPSAANLSDGNSGTGAICHVTGSACGGGGGGGAINCVGATWYDFPFGPPQVSIQTGGVFGLSPNVGITAFVPQCTGLIGKIIINVTTGSGTGCSGGTCGLQAGIYSGAGARLAVTTPITSGGSPNLNTTGFKTLTVVSPVVVSAGTTYFLALGSDSTALVIEVQNVTTTNVAGMLNLNTTRSGIGTNTSTGNGASIALPATLGALTPETNGYGVPPIVMLELSGTGSTNTGTITVATGSSALGTGAIAGNTCATVVTTAATGTVVATDRPVWVPTVDISGVTGYGVASTDGLKIYPYLTADNVNWRVCNGTGTSITPGAVTLNWSVLR